MASAAAAAASRSTSSKEPQQDRGTGPLHTRTPLLRSVALTTRASRAAREEAGDVDVWVKMDAVQPSGSFKIRGIGHLAQTALASGATKLVSSSGGNAGIATAYAASVLGGLEATVVVPSTTPESARDMITAYGADVQVHGSVWDEADTHARGIVQALGKGQAYYVPPFDHPLLWEGHATLVDEVREQLLTRGIDSSPRAIVVSVGGGGLLAGVLKGLQRNGWQHVPVVAAETRGAHSLAHARAEGKVCDLPGGITSVAKSLGAKRVSEHVFRMCDEHPGGVTSVVVSDRAACEACAAFADDHRVLVEPACGAALAAAAYDADCVRSWLGDKGGVVVAVACGGNTVTRDMITQWLAKCA